MSSRRGGGGFQPYARSRKHRPLGEALRAMQRGAANGQPNPMDRRRRAQKRRGMLARKLRAR